MTCRAVSAARREVSRRRRGLAIAAFVALVPGCRDRREIRSENGSVVATQPAASTRNAAPASPERDAGDLGASTAAPPPPQRTPLDAPRIRLEDPRLVAWIEARVASAKAGSPERVRIPLVRHGTGWGCICPPYYVGTNPMMGQGPWLDVTFPKGVRALNESDIVFAEGTFGGTRKHVRYPNGPEPSGYWEYDLIPFAVTATSPMADDPLDPEISLELLGPARSGR